MSGPSAPLLENAICIATMAHANQRDHNGEPYILHPLRVMLRMTDDDERAAAVLHDVLEDNPRITLPGIPPWVVLTVVRLTKRPDETYADYIERVAADPVARRIKLADLDDNLDPRRGSFDGAASLMDRYRRARERLMAAETEGSAAA